MPRRDSRARWDEQVAKVVCLTPRVRQPRAVRAGGQACSGEGGCQPGAWHLAPGTYYRSTWWAGRLGWVVACNGGDGGIVIIVVIGPTLIPQIRTASLGTYHSNRRGKTPPAVCHPGWSRCVRQSIVETRNPGFVVFLVCSFSTHTRTSRINTITIAWASAMVTTLDCSLPPPRMIL